MNKKWPEMFSLRIFLSDPLPQIGQECLPRLQLRSIDVRKPNSGGGGGGGDCTTSTKANALACVLRGQWLRVGSQRVVHNAAAHSAVAQNVLCQFPSTRSFNQTK